MLKAPSNLLNALTTALDAAGIALAIACRVPAPLKILADQVVRSATSVAAKLSEGHGEVRSTKPDPGKPVRIPLHPRT